VIGRVGVPDQLEHKTFVQTHLNRKKLGVVVHGYHPRNGGKTKIEGLQSR
jgi:hypothetical protein